MEEIKGNLFNSKESLCHCVSKDFRMGKGIAVQFKEKFGKVDELIKQDRKIGEVAYIKLEDKRLVFYLITKKRYYDKPTYEDLKLCLKDMYRILKENNIKEISMPRIGCGLDKLDWDKVKEIIKEVLIDIKVTVYIL